MSPLGDWLGIRSAGMLWAAGGCWNASVAYLLDALHGRVLYERRWREEAREINGGGLAVTTISEKMVRMHRCMQAGQPSICNVGAE